MIQLKIILFGLALVGAAALAIYEFYNEQEAPQQYGPNRNRQRRSPSPVSNCSICMFSVSDDIYRRQLYCGHIFHKNCIANWLKERRTCPNCRMSV